MIGVVSRIRLHGVIFLVLMLFNIIVGVQGLFIRVEASTSLNTLFSIQAYSFNRLPPYPQGDYASMNNMTRFYSLKYTPLGSDGFIYNGSVVHLPKGESLILVLAPRPLIEASYKVITTGNANFTRPTLIPVPGGSSTVYENVTMTWSPIAFATLYAIYNYTSVREEYNNTITRLGLNTTKTYYIKWTTSNSSIGYLASTTYTQTFNETILQSLQAYGELPYNITFYTEDNIRIPVPSKLSNNFSTSMNLSPDTIVSNLEANTFYLIINGSAPIGGECNITITVSDNVSQAHITFKLIVEDEEWKFLETLLSENYDNPPWTTTATGLDYTQTRSSEIKIIGYDKYGAAILRYTRVEYISLSEYGTTSGLLPFSKIGIQALLLPGSGGEFQYEAYSKLVYVSYILVGGALPFPSNIWIKADITPTLGAETITVNISTRGVIDNLGGNPDYLGAFGVVNTSDYMYYEQNWDKSITKVSRDVEVFYRTVNLSSSLSNEEFYEKKLNECVQHYVEEYGGGEDDEAYYTIACQLQLLWVSSVLLTPVKDWEWDYTRDYCEAMGLDPVVEYDNGTKTLHICGTRDPQPDFIEDLGFGTVRILEQDIGSGRCDYIIQDGGTYGEMEQCYNTYYEIREKAREFHGIKEYSYPPLPPKVSVNESIVNEYGRIKYLLLYIDPYENNESVWNLNLRLIEYVEYNETYIEKNVNYMIERVNRTIGVKTGRDRNGFLFQAIKYVEYNIVGEPYNYYNHTLKEDYWALRGGVYEDSLPLNHLLNETAGIGLFFTYKLPWREEKIYLSLNVAPNPVDLGGNVTLNVTVFNDRDWNLSYDLELEVNTSNYLVLVDNGSASLVEGNGSSLEWIGYVVNGGSAGSHTVVYKVNNTSSEGVVLDAVAVVREHYSGSQLAVARAKIIIGASIRIVYAQPVVDGNRIVFSELMICSLNSTLVSGNISVKVEVEYDNSEVVSALEKAFTSTMPWYMVRRKDASTIAAAKTKILSDLKDTAFYTYFYENLTLTLNATVSPVVFNKTIGNETYSCRNITVINDPVVNISGPEIVVRAMNTSIKIEAYADATIGNTTVTHKASAKIDDVYSATYEYYKNLLVSIPKLYSAGYDYEHILLSLMIADTFPETFPLLDPAKSKGMDESLEAGYNSIMVSYLVAFQAATGQDNFIDIMVKHVSEIANALLEKLGGTVIEYAKKKGAVVLDKVFAKLKDITDKLKNYISSRSLPPGLRRMAERLFGEAGAIDTAGKLGEAVKKRIEQMRKAYNTRVEEIEKKIGQKYGKIAMLLARKAREHVEKKITDKIKSELDKYKKYYDLDEIKKNIQTRYDNWVETTVKGILKKIGSGLEDLTRYMLRYILYKNLVSNLMKALSQSVSGKLALYLDGRDVGATAKKVNMIIRDYYDSKYELYRDSMYLEMLAKSLGDAGNIIETVLGWTPQGRVAGKVAEVTSKVLGNAYTILVLGLGVIVLYETPRLQAGGMEADLLALNPTLISSPRDLMFLAPRLPRDPTPNYTTIYLNVSEKLRAFRGNLTQNPYSNESMIAFLELAQALDQAYRAEEELWVKAELLLSYGNYTDNASMDNAVNLYAEYSNLTIQNRGVREKILLLATTYYTSGDNTSLQELLAAIDNLTVLNNELGNLTNTLVEEVNANLTIGPLVIVVDTDHNYVIRQGEEYNTTIVLRNIGGLEANNTTLLVFIPSPYTDNISIVDPVLGNVNNTTITIDYLNVSSDYEVNITITGLVPGYYPDAIHYMVFDEYGITYYEGSLDLWVIEPEVNTTVNSSATTVSSYTGDLQVNIPANAFPTTSYITVSEANVYASYGYDTNGLIIYPTTKVYEVYFNTSIQKPLELVFTLKDNSSGQSVYWLNETSGRWEKIYTILNTSSTLPTASCNISEPGLYVVALAYEPINNFVSSYSYKNTWYPSKPVELFVKLNLSDLEQAASMEAYVIVLDYTVNKTYLYPMIPYIALDGEALLKTNIPPIILVPGHSYAYIYYIRSPWGSEWSSPQLNATVPVNATDTTPPNITVYIRDPYGVESTSTTAGKLYITLSATDDFDPAPTLCYVLDNSVSKCIRATLKSKIELVVNSEAGYSGSHLLVVNATDSSGNTRVEKYVLKLEGIPEPTCSYSIEEYNESLLVLGIHNVTEHALWDKIGFIELSSGLVNHEVDLNVPLVTPTMAYIYDTLDLGAKVPYAYIKGIGSNTSIPVLLSTLYAVEPTGLLDLYSWRNSSWAIVELNETHVPVDASEDVGVVQVAVTKYYTSTPSLIVGFEVRGDPTPSNEYILALNTSSTTANLTIYYDNNTSTWKINGLASSEYSLAHRGRVFVILLRNIYSPSIWSTNISVDHLSIRIMTPSDTTPYLTLRFNGRIKAEGFSEYFNPKNNVFAANTPYTAEFNVSDHTGIAGLKLVLFLGNGSIITVNGSLVSGDSWNGTWSFNIPPLPEGYFTPLLVGEDLEGNTLALPYITTMSSPTPRVTSGTTPPIVVVVSSPSNVTVSNTSILQVNVSSDPASTVSMRVLEKPTWLSVNLTSPYSALTPYNVMLELSVNYSLVEYTRGYLILLFEANNTSVVKTIIVDVEYNNSSQLSLTYIEPTPANNTVVTSAPLVVNVSSNKPIYKAYAIVNGSSVEARITPNRMYAYIEYYNLSNGTITIWFNITSIYGDNATTTPLQYTTTVNVDLALNLSITVKARGINDTIGHRILLVNTGSTQDTFILTVDRNDTWLVPSEITLKPNESAIIRIVNEPHVWSINNYTITVKSAKTNKTWTFQAKSIGVPQESIYSSQAGGGEIIVDAPTMDSLVTVEANISGGAAVKVYVINKTPLNIVPEGYNTSINSTIDLVVVNKTNIEWPIKITINYTELNTTTIIENSLTLFYWNGTQWVQVENQTINTQLKIIEAYLTRQEVRGAVLALYAVKVPPIPIPEPPLIPIVMVLMILVALIGTSIKRKHN